MLILPPSLTLTGTPSSPRGRSLVATQSFSPGSPIAFFTTPSIAIPDSNHLSTTCSYCLSISNPSASIPIKVRACTGCKTVYYCSPSCQKSDWSLVHKAECKVFQRVRAEVHDVLPTPVRGLVQMLLMRVSEMLLAAAEMEGHVDEFRSGRGSNAWADMELQGMAALHYMGRETNARSLASAVEILCKLQVNSFNRLDVDIDQTGMFVNPALAIVNHSCVPNTFVQFIGRKAVLRAYQAIKEGEEVEISYIDKGLHRSYRQRVLKERYHFDCMCPRCKDDLDVYRVCQDYPHLTLNSFSLTPDLNLFRHPPVTTSFHSNKALQQNLEELYRLCSEPCTGPGSSMIKDPAYTLRQRWRKCEELREAKLFAMDPLVKVMVEASIYFGERGDFAYSLALSCFLALNSDPFRNPAPFSPQRIKGLLMISKLLSHTGAESASAQPGNDGSVRSRLAQSLMRMDQATMAQAILRMAVHYGPLAHSEEWQVYREASQLLKDIESLPGREKECAAIKFWVKEQNDLEGRLFFDHAVLKPIQELSGFALEIMSVEFESEQSLVHEK